MMVPKKPGSGQLDKTNLPHSSLGLGSRKGEHNLAPEMNIHIPAQEAKKQFRSVV